MVAIGLLAAAGILMWAANNAMRLSAGQPVRLRISSENMSKPMRQAGRVITNLSIAGAVLAYPLITGQRPLAYFGQLLPWDDRAWAGWHGFWAALLFLTLLYLAWLATDNVRFRIRHKPGRIARRLAVLPFSAALGAFAEELLFRGVVLADLLKSIEAAPAVILATLLFAAAHYVRPVKRYWTFPGHLAFGTLLSAGFVWTHSLWLSVGVHAAGIFLILGLRPFVRYTGPPWLVGASIFPYAGVAGILASILLTISIWLSLGGH